MLLHTISVSFTITMSRFLIDQRGCDVWYSSTDMPLFFKKAPNRVFIFRRAWGASLAADGPTPPRRSDEAHYRRSRIARMKLGIGSGLATPT